MTFVLVGAILLGKVETNTNKGDGMKFVMEFNMDSAAFDDNMATEIGTILRAVAADCEVNASTGGSIRDTNGNRIGEFRIHE